MGAADSHVEEKHIRDYVRVLYKRRWIAIPAFLIVFVTMTVNTLRETPLYQGRAQLLIEKDAPNVATLDQMFQSQEGWFNDEFYQTQNRILQSRSLAKRTIDQMKLWDAPRLGNGPLPRAAFSPTGLLWSMVNGALSLARRPFAQPPSAPAETAEAEPRRGGETPAQSGRIDEFLAERRANRDVQMKLNYEYITEWETTHEEGLRGAYDAEQRDKEMDADGVAAEVIFPDADAITGMESPPFGAGLSAGMIGRWSRRGWRLIGGRHSNRAGGVAGRERLAP